MSNNKILLKIFIIQGSILDLTKGIDIIEILNVKHLNLNLLVNFTFKIDFKICQ